jgi:hypothetical protein
MNSYNELEVELDSLDAENYRVTLRFTKGAAVLSTPREVGPENVHIDREALLESLQKHDFAAYGRLLRDAIFFPPDIHALFIQACKETPLRVKLKLDPTDRELHSLRWEMLAGPDDTVLSSKENVATSRYLPSGREVSLRREPDELRALIVVVDPSPEDREKYGLSAIDVDYARRAASLSPILCDPLTSDDGPVTMNKLITQLKAGADEFGGYDILYLVCHGAMVRGGTHLLLDLETEEEKGNKSYFRSGEVLVRRLAEEVTIMPRLVLLASCASAGTGDDNALAALGPLMARAGIPAVIAMQGYVQIQTVEEFIPVFFKSLMKSGEVDRAMREARSHIKNNKNYHDWWMPALFMRLATSRIWYTPGFDVQAADEDDLWSRVTSHVALKRGFDRRLRSRCTPVLGPGLGQHLFGSDSSLASRWAQQHNYPLLPYHQDQFPRVTQYLKVQRLGEEEVKLEYWDQLHEGLRRRYPQVLGESDLVLDEMIELLWQDHLKDDPLEPHNILARLPFTCYVTTNPTSVLEVALHHQGRTPQVEVYNWRDERSRERLRRDDDFPTHKEPLVFHALGHFSEPDSLVLSEDDYFSYLIHFIRYWSESVSSGVNQALTDASLLFLGFRIFRWDFRIIFHSLLSQGNRRIRDKYPHVAAQISPREGAFLNPTAARAYLNKYFSGENPDEIKLDIYWGETTDFLVKLNQKWPKENDRGSALS